MRARLLCAGIVLLALIVPARADFADGLAAYDGGDYASAVKAWRPLAETGDAEAQVALAGMYATGNGVRQDLGQAVRWYVRAARQGHAVGQLNAGDYLARGWGVRRDLVTAYVWLSLAAAQGRAWAASRRDEVAHDMSRREIAEAEARIAVWRPTKED